MSNRVINTVGTWLVTTKLLSFPRKLVGDIMGRVFKKGVWAVGKTHFVFLVLYGKHNIDALDVITEIKKETELLLTDLEASQIYTAVKKTEKIDGSVAEVGTYKGGSAKIIREATKKPLHLFDTFEGLPEISHNDSSTQHHRGQYAASYDSVKNYLKGYPDIHFYKGLFPSTAQPVKDMQFSFVHLDVDIYGSTLDCLEFFYPRMSRGGVIISHDYPNAVGVKKAFDEFFEHKPEIVIRPLGTRQGFLVKT